MSILDIEHYLVVRDAEKQIDALNLPPIERSRAYFGILYEFFILKDYDNMLRVAAKINFDIYDPATDPEIEVLRNHINDFSNFVITLRWVLARQLGEPFTNKFPIADEGIEDQENKNLE
jgi:hypothetical protein